MDIVRRPYRNLADQSAPFGLDFSGFHGKYFPVGVAKRQRDLYPIVYANEANTKQGRSLMETIVTEILEIIKGAKDSISREERIRSSPEDLA